MKKKWVTIHEVAKKAGVSSMSVSRYLKDKNSVKNRNAKLIKQAIVDTGYLPNKMAGTLAGGQSSVIGIILPTLSISMFRNMLHIISTMFSDMGIELIVGVTNYNETREAEILHNFLSWRVKGLILTGVNQPPKTLQIIERSKTPCIHIADTDTPDNFPHIAIGCSHYQGGYNVAQYMGKQGYKNLAYMSTEMAFFDYRNNNRYQGFSDGIHAVGGTVSEKINIGKHINVKVGFKSIQKCNFRQWDGIMFPSDELATGAILGLLKQGVKIPEDIAICGYHGSDISQYLPVSLTTYAISWDEMGQAVLDTFIKIWNNTPISTHTIHIPARIIKGDSC